MRRNPIRKMVAGAGLSAAVLFAAASPAFAHFCIRIDFNEMAASRAGGSKAWLTADEWREFLPFIAEECPPETVDAVEAILDAADEHTLFMGPGLLAGGTIGKGKTPRHFDYMLDAFATCQ